MSGIGSIGGPSSAPSQGSQDPEKVNTGKKQRGSGSIGSEPAELGGHSYSATSISAQGQAAAGRVRSAVGSLVSFIGRGFSALGRGLSRLGRGLRDLGSNLLGRIRGSQGRTVGADYWSMYKKEGKEDLGEGVGEGVVYFGKQGDDAPGSSNRGKKSSGPSSNPIFMKELGSVLSQRGTYEDKDRDFTTGEGRVKEGPVPSGSNTGSLRRPSKGESPELLQELKEKLKDRKESDGGEGSASSTQADPNSRPSAGV